MIISSGTFFIFSKFQFSGFLGEEKGEKWLKMTKDSVRHTPYLRTMHDMIVIYCAYV